MSHVRTQIRDAASALLTGIAAVSVSRVYPVNERELPALLVSTESETISAATLNLYLRQLELVVECVTQGPNVDTDLDALAAQVEAVLNRNTLGGLCRPLLPLRFDLRIDIGSTTIGRLRMTYLAAYHTAFSAPEVAA